MRRAFALCAVRLACENSARLTIYKLGRGKRSLSVIACISPLLGVLSMLEGTRQELRIAALPYDADVAGGWSEVFVLFALSILVSSIAIVCHGLMSAMIERFRLEMKTATLRLMNDLARPSANV
jgi:biopolymer transport protein ExbB/TolQ